MKIGILTTNKINDKPEDQKLIEAAERLGHEVIFLYVLKCSLSISSSNPYIYYDGKRIDDDIDVIIPRIDMPHIEYGLYVLRQFRALGVPCTDNPRAIGIGHNKLECMQFLMEHNVPLPCTAFAHAQSDYDDIINAVGGVPLIAKLLEGTQGVGVFLATDEKHAKNFLKTFKQLDEPLLVQEFIEESAGQDIRAFVVGDEIVASMERHSKDGDFRANISLGGKSVASVLSDVEKELVLSSTKAIGINIGGVDFVRSKKGPLVIEINTAPDFSGPSGLDEVTGIDVAECILNYAVAHASRNMMPEHNLKLVQETAA
jgi:ribosomal protein S6--L-glutamate ligase